MNLTMIKPGIAAAIFSLSIVSSSTSFAQSTNANVRKAISLELEEITDNSLERDFFDDDREIAPNGLPDGRIATGTGNIAQAYYTEPTTRYRHAVLGDGIEGGALKIVTSSGQRYTFRLPRTEVFEDITPRIADLDGDGNFEVISIVSSVTQGGSMAVFRLNGNAFLKVAQTPFIGRANRWLNIAEITDITGQRNPEICLVVRPHLDGVLQFYQFRNDNLNLVANYEGLSNHQIGSGELRLSASFDVDRNGIFDLAIPSLSRDELVFFGLVRNRLVEIARLPLPAKIVKAIETREINGREQLVLGLDDEKAYSVTLQ